MTSYALEWKEQNKAVEADVMITRVDSAKPR